jgi:hypothetical protein
VPSQVDATQNELLKKRFGIRGYPTILLYVWRTRPHTHTLVVTTSEL